MTNLRMSHNLYIQVIAQLNPVTIIDESHNFDGSLNVTSLLGKVKPGGIKTNIKVLSPLYCKGSISIFLI